MIASTAQPNSEISLLDQINKLADAGGSVIQVRTREPVRAAVTLRKHLIGSSTPYKEWDVVNGWRVFTKDNFADHQVRGTDADFIDALQAPLRDLRSETSPVRTESDKIHFFVYIDPHAYMKDNPFSAQHIQQYAALLPSTNVCIIMVTNDEPLPGVAVGNALVADFATPNVDELKELLIRVVEAALKNEDSFPEGSELTEDDVQQIAHMGLGLTLYEFETYASIAIIDGNLLKETAITAARLLDGIGKGKTAVIRQSDILELVPARNIEEVGGMQRLKDWVSQRADCYSIEAKEFGVEPPKGAGLVGVPGTGKSLVAQAVAGVFGVPLVRMDFARVFSKYVGDSESRVRAALKMVEAMAPCVLFVDEIDKGLGGAGGGGDSGTSSRVLGSFLTWLQVCEAPVFTIVTANRVEGLPPELLRRGRFDQIFSLGMPHAESRKEVLGIHVKKRGREMDIFSEKDIADFMSKSEGYVPAEIESAVKDAITNAYGDKDAEGLEMRHILKALDDMVPMSVSNAAAIARIVEWAAVNATPVEYTDKQPKPTSKGKTPPAPSKPTARVIRTRAR